MHTAEQNGESGKMGTNGKYTRSPRTLRRGDGKDDERCDSHGRVEHEERETHLQRWSHLCVRSLHMYYKWMLWFNHQTVSHIEGNGKLEQGEN